MKKTKIICTIGPACGDKETIEKMIMAGMNVARFNMSHGNHTNHEQMINLVRESRDELGSPVAIMIDTKGPEVRVKDFAGGGAELVENKKFILTTEDVLGDSSRVSVTYKNLPKYVKKGSKILINDGAIELKVTETSSTEIHTKVVVGGYVSNKKSINVPNTDLHIPYVSKADEEDIKFACKIRADFLALSFVSKKEDVLEIKKLLEKYGGKDIKLISKIENQSGVSNAHEIIEVSDGLMVARGDLGVEVEFQKIPIIQKQLISECNSHGKISITATQMLESMITNNRPTRAEISDVANAIIDGTTAIMLSGETSVGAHPALAVETMLKIATETENATSQDEFEYYSTENLSQEAGYAYGICAIAHGFSADAIICTEDYSLCQKISAFRPSQLVVMSTKNKDYFEQASMLYNTLPIYKVDSFEKVCKKLVDEKYIGKNCKVIKVDKNTISIHNI